MTLTPEVWRQIDPLLTDALDMEPAARAVWLEALDRTHPQLAPLLRKMLAAHDRALESNALETVPQLAPTPARASDFIAGTQVGPFRLVRPIGTGGMGEVWLAQQVDGRVERQVALKLPMVNHRGDVWRERFRRERDILARLAHPNIARLYDAGVSEVAGSEGQPYLAMEYIEGEALGDYAVKNRLSIADRLKLFQQVLAAVAHAHRHLVVHRDLKPANILIDGSGEVKLLDFGIAKLIDDAESTGAADLTRMGGRVMTLRYAAPEQATGGAISTATDIYSLGVILHELVTGLSPYRAIRDGKALTEAVLLGEEAMLPSSLAITEEAAAERQAASANALARQVAGDLDAIILKAMRRNPADRYAAVEQLDEEIRRHLDNRPVHARDGTWRYLAGRFIARHKWPMAAAAVVVLTMLAGLILVEQQRRIALAEKTRAEKHFASVRALANSFIFDVHGEIENLAGSLKARQILISTSLKYLDSLAGESRDDPALALEVAGAYRRLAEIKGDSRGAHLGEAGSARRNAERASALLQTAGAREPDNINILREHRVVALLLGRMMLEAGDSTGVDETLRAVRLAEKAAGLPGAEIADRRDLGATLAEYGGILAVVKDDHAGAARQSARAVDVLASLVRENPADLTSRARLAYALERAAMAAEVSGRQEKLTEAIGLLEKSIATTEAVIRDDAANLAHSQTLVKRYNNAARVYLRAGDIDAARERAAKAHALIGRLLAADPRNVGNATMLAGVLAMASDIEFRDRRHARAIALAREALAADANLPAETRAGLIVRENAAGAMRSLALSNCALAEAAAPASPRRTVLLNEARSLLAKSRAFKQELVDRRIDAREAGLAIVEIDAELKRCESIASAAAASAL